MTPGDPDPRIGRALADVLAATFAAALLAEWLL
jgi:hypothetical protein